MLVGVGRDKRQEVLLVEKIEFYIFFIPKDYNAVKMSCNTIKVPLLYQL